MNHKKYEIELNGNRYELPPPEVAALMLPAFNMLNNRTIGMGDIGSRNDLAETAGIQFGGNRNLYKVLGYKRNIELRNYDDMYERQDIASRIVELPAQDTWREPPQIVEGSGKKTKEDTKFTTAVDAAFDDLKAWTEIENLDVISGIGHYGVLLIGYSGDIVFSEKPDPADVPVYLRAYSEMQASVKEYETNQSSPRFGLPLMYKIKMDGDKEYDIHWSRCIHVAEGARKSRVFGTPRLKKVFNRLWDLEKIIGGSAEAHWRLAYKGIVMELKEGFEAPADEDEITELQTRVHNWVNDIYRFLIADGYTVRQEGGESVDPSAIVDVIISIIAATTGIPKRLLTGAELGRIASTQDAANWAGRITSRRTRFAEPVILRPLIDMLIERKVVPPPRGGEYEIKWKPLFELTDLEIAQIASLKASAANALTGGLAELILGLEEMRELLGYEGMPPPPVMLPDPRKEEPTDDSQGETDDETDDEEGDETTPGENGDGDGTPVPNTVIWIRHQAERVAPSSEAIPHLPIYQLDDAKLQEAINDFNQRHPEFKGLLETALAEAT